MPRKPRFLSPQANGHLVEVSCRTLESRAFLRPSRNANELIVGVLGRAHQVSPVEICAMAFPSTHYHLLLNVPDQNHLSGFMHHLNTNLSKEINRLYDRTGPLWSRRYDAILVSEEPEAQWNRLKYVLAQGTKEGMVKSPMLWPGVHSASQLITGTSHEGYWFHWAKEWAARRRGESFDPYDYATRYRVDLAQLPCFQDMEPEEYRERVEALIRDIEQEALEQRQGRPFLGVEAILQQDPLEKITKGIPAISTQKPSKSPKPEFHAASREARASFRTQSFDFYNQYYTAAQLVREGKIEAVLSFPEGSFPSPFPFRGQPLPPRPAPPPSRNIARNVKDTQEGRVPIVEAGGKIIRNAGNRDP